MYICMHIEIHINHCCKNIEGIQDVQTENAIVSEKSNEVTWKVKRERNLLPEKPSITFKL
jgi:hypothetical protein